MVNHRFFSSESRTLLECRGICWSLFTLDSHLCFILLVSFYLNVFFPLNCFQLCLFCNLGRISGVCCLVILFAWLTNGDLALGPFGASGSPQLLAMVVMTEGCAALDRKWVCPTFFPFSSSLPRYVRSERNRGGKGSFKKRKAYPQVSGSAHPSADMSETTFNAHSTKSACCWIISCPATLMTAYYFKGNRIRQR